MGEKSPLPLQLATGNKGKIAQFISHAPTGIEVGNRTPLFNEDEIKRTVKQKGVEEIAAISRGKFFSQKEELKRSEGETSDYTVIVSDSAILVPVEGDERGLGAVVHRDTSTGDEKDKALEQMYEAGKATFVGAVTFGRKNGLSAFTILSYIDVPLSEDKKIVQLPIPIGEIGQYTKQNGKYEVGYYECYEKDGTFHYRKKPIATTTNFDGESNEISARPFVSGLTPDVLSLAEKSMVMDRDVSPIVQKLIGAHPFNTLSFYALYEQAGRPPIIEFYRDLLANKDEFFNAHGGNCSLFTLALVDELNKQGIVDYKVLLYPSKTGVDKDGHSAIGIYDEDTMYLADPGLTIPWIVPINRTVPIFPFERTGEKQMLVQISNRNEDVLPDMTVIGPKGLQLFESQQATGVENFVDILPSILTRLHNQRTDVKLDVHDKVGQKKLNLSVKRTDGTMTLFVGTRKMVVATEEYEASDARKELERECGEVGINYENLHKELQRVFNSM